MGERGLVINTKDHLAVIQMTRTEACGQCRACLAGMKEEEMIIEADNECNAKVGDWVIMELRNNSFMKAVLIMYGIPMIALVIGIVLGYYVLYPYIAIDREVLSFGMGLLFTALAFLWIRSKESTWDKKKIRPVATKITTEKE